MKPCILAAIADVGVCLDHDEVPRPSRTIETRPLPPTWLAP